MRTNPEKRFPSMRVMMIAMIGISGCGAKAQPLTHGAELKRSLLAQHPEWSPNLPIGPQADFTEADRQRQRAAWKVVAGEIRKAGANQGGTYQIPEGHYRIPPERLAVVPTLIVAPVCTFRVDVKAVVVPLPMPR
jgi:hypothetical protein